MTETTNTAAVEGLGLAVALRRLGVERQSGHCGEGSVERMERERHNEAVDVVLAALKPAPAPSLEEIARIVDPVAMRSVEEWAAFIAAAPDRLGWVEADIHAVAVDNYHTYASDRHRARAKATAILQRLAQSKEASDGPHET